MTQILRIYMDPLNLFDPCHPCAIVFENIDYY